MKRYLICCGDSNDINAWSGIPYHILSMAKDLSIELEGLRFEPDKLSKYRILWNLKQLLQTGHYSGFQYSDFFLEKLFNQARINKEDEISLISTYPLLPYKSFKKCNLFFYIDATIKQIFHEYGGFKNISTKYKKQILMKEKDNYDKSKLIFCMSSWAKNSLINDYGISFEKIQILPGGANIDSKYLSNFKYNNYIPKPPSKSNPLRIGFLGQDWLRKGGPIALEVVKILNYKSIPTVLRVMGVSNKKFLKSEYIQNTGFVDKNNQMKKFISEIKTWHFGTLFSKAEAYGISNRECFLLGVPILCHDVGGIRSTFSKEQNKCGYIFKANEDPEFIANWVINIVNNYSKYIKLRSNLSQINSQFTWETTLKKMFYQISLVELNNQTLKT